MRSLARVDTITLSILILVLQACGEARYRVESVIHPLDGAVPAHIAILNSTAARKIAEIHLLYASASDSLKQTFADSLSAIDKVLAAQAKPIQRAARRLRNARGAYAVAFKAMNVFTSFGGNQVFDSADQKVSTRKLLEDIADRFYRGKAFSLETGGQIRRTIRKKLVPAEQRVASASGALNRLRDERKIQEELREAVAGEVAISMASLLEVYNRRVIDRLEGAVIREVSADSSRVYRFEQVPTGKYHLYTREPKVAFVEVIVKGHRRFRILENAPSPLVSNTKS